MGQPSKVLVPTTYTIHTRCCFVFPKFYQETSGFLAPRVSHMFREAPDRSKPSGFPIDYKNRSEKELYDAGAYEVVNSYEDMLLLLDKL